MDKKRILLITANFDAREIKELSDILPKESVIYHATPGIHNFPRLNAKHEDYDLIVVSPEIANHYYMPAIIDSPEEKSQVRVNSDRATKEELLKVAKKRDLKYRSPLGN